MVIFPHATVPVRPRVVQNFVNVQDLGQWRSVLGTSFLLYVTAHGSPALSMAVHIGSANVNGLIDAARNTEINGLVQGLNAVKPKLMMRGERLV